MQATKKTLGVFTMGIVLSSMLVFAQDHHPPPPHYVRHDEWHSGARISHGDWNRGVRINYQTYHLQVPPHGYAWRQVDGYFVLAAVATGMIAATVVAATAQ